MSADVAPEAAEPVPPTELDPSGSGAVGLLVFGMHRSGMSAVAGMLSGAGFVPGSGDDLTPPDEDNPAGLFERRSVVELNDRILERAGGAWDEPPPRESLEAVRDEFLPELHTLMDRLTEGTLGSPLVVKDPRISLLLPLWLPVARATLDPVLVLRNPIETARSLANCQAMPLSLGLGLWELYMSALLQGLDGTSVQVARFEELIDRPERRRELVASATQALRPSLAGMVRQEAAASTIDRGLHRYRASESEFVEHATVRQTELWAFLAELGTGAVTIRAPESLRSPGRAARATVLQFSQQRRHAQELASRLSRTCAELDALDAESRARDARVDELTTAVDLLAGKTESQRAELERGSAAHAQLEREHDAQLLEANGQLERAGATHVQLEEANRGLQGALADAHASCDALLSEIADLRSSETWRVGRYVIRPVAWLKRRPRPAE